jgi:Xaa-Pro aminopeptidase
VGASEFAARRRAVAEGLAERKLDAFLAAFSPNLRYLTGFTGSNGSLLITPEQAILFTDPRYTIQAAEETRGAGPRARGAAAGTPPLPAGGLLHGGQGIRADQRLRTNIAKGPLVDEVAAAIAKAGVKRIGYEPARMTCDAFEALKARLPMRAALHPVHGWIEEMRMVKSPDEIERIRRSVLTNSRAFEQAVARLKPGISERDFAAELEYRMRRLGAGKPAFETIVAGGARSALPHAQPTAAALASGFVVVDMGAFVDGYASDMTRMLHIGAPGAKAKRAYKAVLEAHLAAIDSVRPGILAYAPDRVARAVLKRYGLDRAFVHSTGHGLGLEIHEPPRIGKRDKTRLRAGMAITIEPGVYLEGWGGIRIEDTVVVTESGCEILTPTAKELRVI